MKKILKKIAGFFTANQSHSTEDNNALTESEEQELWQKVYDARSDFYEKNIGRLPSDILKMMNLIGVWPGGGLFALEATQLKEKCWAYTSFGLSNADMPTTLMMNDAQQEVDEQGRVSQYSFNLQLKKNARKNKDVAGYGFELLIITKENAEWPINLMQWLVSAEIVNEAGILARVEKNKGLTVEDVQFSDQDSVHILIAKAQHPLPSEIHLPNGKMKFLIATVITEDEMEWSIKNGRDALLDKLMQSNVGQISDRGRASIFV